MYQPIKFKHPNSLMESFKVDDGISEQLSPFSEAYFTNGREMVEPVIECFRKIKEDLNNAIKSSSSKFDAISYIKSLSFKELEDTIRGIFGLRSTTIIIPYTERYDPTTDDFSSHVMNCYTYLTWRYPIDGIVTEKGFYDSTHSITCEVLMALGIIYKLTPEELTACFLHELGHNIDPAAVDIKYATINEFSKYVTERQTEKPTQGTGDKKKDSSDVGTNTAASLITVLIVTLPFIIIALIEWIKNKFPFNVDRFITQLKMKLRSDKDKFDRVYSSEAFSDNIARMYGFGPELISALYKMKKYFNDRHMSRIEKEKQRQRAIARMTLDALNDEHKTDLHRIYALIREYEADLKDPLIPAKVKNDIAEDLNELKEFLNKYINDFDNFTNRINKVILKELEKKYGKIESTPVPDKTGEVESEPSSVV